MSLSAVHETSLSSEGDLRHANAFGDLPILSELFTEGPSLGGSLQGSFPVVADASLRSTRSNSLNASGSVTAAGRARSPVASLTSATTALDRPKDVNGLLGHIAERKSRSRSPPHPANSLDSTNGALPPSTGRAAPSMAELEHEWAGDLVYGAPATGRPAAPASASRPKAKKPRKRDTVFSSLARKSASIARSFSQHDRKAAADRERREEVTFDDQGRPSRIGDYTLEEYETFVMERYRQSKRNRQYGKKSYQKRSANASDRVRVKGRFQKVKKPAPAGTQAAPATSAPATSTPTKPVVFVAAGSPTKAHQRDPLEAEALLLDGDLLELGDGGDVKRLSTDFGRLNSGLANAGAREEPKKRQLSSGWRSTHDERLAPVHKKAG